MASRPDQPRSITCIISPYSDDGQAYCPQPRHSNGIPCQDIAVTIRERGLKYHLISYRYAQFQSKVRSNLPITTPPGQYFLNTFVSLPSPSMPRTFVLYVKSDPQVGLPVDRLLQMPSTSPRLSIVTLPIVVAMIWLTRLITVDISDVYKASSTFPVFFSFLG